MLLEIIQTISDLIKGRDCFATRETRRPILGYKFGIYTGDSKPVYYFQLRYGVHQSKMIVIQNETLLHNGHIGYSKSSFMEL